MPKTYRNDLDIFEIPHPARGINILLNHLANLGLVLPRKDDHAAAEQGGLSLDGMFLKNGPFYISVS